MFDEKKSLYWDSYFCSVTLPTSATEQGFSKYNQGVRGVSPGRHAKFKDNEQVCVHAYVRYTYETSIPS